MATDAERREPQPEAPEGVKEIIEPEPPESLKGVVQQVPSKFTAQVTDDQGQPLIQTPQTQTITVPATQQQLDDWSKGSPTNALTWFAVFWIRMVKKAFYFGWRLVSGNEADESSLQSKKE